jgi:hypothetical protein
MESHQRTLNTYILFDTEKYLLGSQLFFRASSPTETNLWLTTSGIKTIPSLAQWLIPLIPDTQEEETGKIML